jgi:hypothetical protein
MTFAVDSPDPFMLAIVRLAGPAGGRLEPTDR